MIMKIHYLQHVFFEDLANIKEWALQRNHSISRTFLPVNEPFPALKNFEWLIIMGGSMNVNEEQEFPWLKREKKFIKKAIDGEKVVLGICLGAQLIANVLGATIYKNKHAEIGWFPITLTKEALPLVNASIFRGFPENFLTFHWHEDTFSLPNNAKRLARSEACENQAFQFKDKVIGVQFHLESSLASISRLIKNCPEDLREGNYIQKDKDLLLNPSNVARLTPLMELFLNNVEQLY